MILDLNKDRDGGYELGPEEVSDGDYIAAKAEEMESKLAAGVELRIVDGVVYECREMDDEAGIKKTEVIQYGIEDDPDKKGEKVVAWVSVTRTKVEPGGTVVWEAITYTKDGKEMRVSSRTRMTSVDESGERRVLEQVSNGRDFINLDNGRRLN